MFGTQATVGAIIPINCAHCLDTGWRQYDHNHSTVCGYCCKHDQGFWRLTKGYAYYVSDIDTWCCKRGCGHTKTNEELFAFYGHSPTITMMWGMATTGDKLGYFTNG